VDGSHVCFGIKACRVVLEEPEEETPQVQLFLLLPTDPLLFLLLWLFALLPPILLRSRRLCAL
jgi:hypothetical protein